MNDISDLIDQLKVRRIKSVALQFPEGLKRKAAGIASGLRESGFEVIVNGDPCYGACDLALETLKYADVLIHFGHAPVSERPDVIYEPYRIDFDIAVLEKAVPLLKGTVVGLVTTIQHAHLVPAMGSFLQEMGFEVHISKGSERTPHPGQVLGCSFEAATTTGAAEILYVGTGLFHPIGIALSTQSRVIALDPITGIASEVSSDTLLRRRFAVMEKARRAASVGIIVSTKSGQQRLDLARRLASLSPIATIVMMREVIPDELLNLGFEMYVNTACPRIAYDDQIRFPVPVLAPPEFEIICEARSWDDYIIDEIP